MKQFINSIVFLVGFYLNANCQEIIEEAQDPAKYELQELINTLSNTTNTYNPPSYLNIPTNSFIDLDFESLSPLLLPKAFKDLKAIQDSLLAHSGGAEILNISPVLQGFQLLQEFGPVGILGFPNCPQSALKNLTSDLPFSTLRHFIWTLDSSYTTNYAGSSFFNRTVNPFTSNNGLAGVLDLSNRDNPLEAGNASPCQIVSAAGDLTEMFGKWLNIVQSVPYSIVGNFESFFKNTIETLRTLIQRKASSYELFAFNVIDSIYNHLQEKDDTLISLAQTAKNRVQRSAGFSTATGNIFLEDFENWLDAAVNTSVLSINPISSLQPILYTWFETPLVMASGTGSFLRGIVQPFTGSVGAALVPFAFGSQIQQLAQIDPRLTGLFNHFNNPMTAPIFVSMKALLDEISRTGTLPGLEQFSYILKPYESLLQPLGLHLGVANAFLNYMNQMSDI